MSIENELHARLKQYDGWEVNRRFHEEVLPVLSDYVRTKLRELGEEIKDEIAERFDAVKVIPKDPARQKEAETMHKVIVYMHQQPIDAAVERFCGKED